MRQKKREVSTEKLTKCPNNPGNLLKLGNLQAKLSHSQVAE